MSLDPWSYAAKTRNEYAEQVALFMWAACAQNYGPNIANDPHSYNVKDFAKTQFEGKGGLGYIRHSEPLKALEWLHAIKNAGHGDKIRGAMSKAEGVKPGVPDIHLPVPKLFNESAWGRPFYKQRHGLYIELKRLASERGAAGKASPDQERWHNHLRSSGYAIEVCYGWEAARDVILKYLGGFG